MRPRTLKANRASSAGISGQWRSTPDQGGFRDPAGSPRDGVGSNAAVERSPHHVAILGNPRVSPVFRGDHTQATIGPTQGYNVLSDEASDVVGEVLVVLQMGVAGVEGLGGLRRSLEGAVLPEDLEVVDICSA